MKSLVLIDNGGANLGSLQNAFARLGAQAVLSRDAGVISDADRVVLPGVGAAGASMRRLRETGIDEVILQLRQPVLGICLGMHLLYERSAENASACFGVLPGEVSELPSSETARVPHMGWNRLDDVQRHPVLHAIDKSCWFYFAHSYAAPINSATVAGCVNGTRFSAVAAKDNFVTAQFHPERSGDAGARILKNFLAWDGCN